MTANPNAPLFADRYRFETVSDDWDRGRSGSTDLVYDLKEERLGVIKRAEVGFKQSLDGLKSEIEALKALRGLGVPEVYDTGRAVYGSKNYDYMVVEYIDRLRVEKNLSILSAVERAEIITNLLGLLSQAHLKGIVNGDVDLKHLFWNKDKKQIVVIDWGNARHGVNPIKKTEFAYDLARVAEVIFSLVTRQIHPPVTGSIALPDNSSLIDGLGPVPYEFRLLCKWAPRTPSASAQAPFTVMELFEVSKKWRDAIRNSKTFKQQPPRFNKLMWFTSVMITLAIFFVMTLKPFGFSLFSAMYSGTNTVIVSETPALSLSDTPTITETTLPSIVPTKTGTATSAVTPSPKTYSPILTFDSNLSLDKCWKNESSSILILGEGFYRRDDLDWGFEIQNEHPTAETVQVDFGQCLENKNVEALSINITVNRLEYESPREIGIFLENQNGQRREYTLWLDKNKIMYLRVREDKNILKDEPILVISPKNLHFGGESPHLYIQFPIQIFFELNNQGLDIIYLLESSLDKQKDINIDPSQMIRMDNAVFPTMGDIQKVGLVGYGGQTETIIWPLNFLEGKLK